MTESGIQIIFGSPLAEDDQDWTGEQCIGQGFTADLDENELVWFYGPNGPQDFRSYQDIHCDPLCISHSNDCINCHNYGQWIDDCLEKVEEYRLPALITDNPVFQRFISHLPKYPHCMNEKGAMSQHSKRVALSYKRIALNKHRRLYLPFDLDIEDSRDQWSKVGLPEPTIIVGNRDNGKCHFFYELKNPVLMVNLPWINKGPQDFYRSLWREMATLLASDLGYTRYIVKNPLSGYWHVETNDIAYGMIQLSRAVTRAKAQIKPDPEQIEVEKSKREFKKPELTFVVDGTSVIPEGQRHPALFEIGRRFAYIAVRKAQSERELYQVILEYLLDVDRTRCKPPKGYEHARDMAEYIASWVWDNRKNLMRGKGERSKIHSRKADSIIPNRYRQRPNQGVMNLEPMPFIDLDRTDYLEEVKQRKSIGAIYRNQKQKERTISQIKEVIEQLTKEGKKITATAIAKILGMHRIHIGRYKHLWSASNSDANNHN
jgi:hypothetical protein